MAKPSITPAGAALDTECPRGPMKSCGGDHETRESSK
jgi:hypothetical protein